MRASEGASSSVVLWQGFRHKWQYNHRANRLGSFVEHRSLSGDSCEADVVHAAASGTGPDRADFTGFFTKVKVGGVGFKPGVREVKIRTIEEKLEYIYEEITVALEGELANKDKYSVVLNGFDLCAEGDADKLATLYLEVGNPFLDEGRTALTFAVAGAFRVDCSSPDCDRRKPSEKSRRQSLRTLTDKVSELDERSNWRETGPGVDHTTFDEYESLVEFVEESKIDSGDEVRYTLRVHYVVVAGDDHELQITQSDAIEHEYEWDRRGRYEIGDPTGRHPVPPIQGSQGYGASTLAFKRIFVDLTRKKGPPLTPWKQDIAMHLLELNMAISDIIQDEMGRVTATLDLFFKNWRKGMKRARPWRSWFAYKDAGGVLFGVKLVLLQFKAADVFRDTFPDSIEWEGRDQHADTDAALKRNPVEIR